MRTLVTAFMLLAAALAAASAEAPPAGAAAGAAPLRLNLRRQTLAAPAEGFRVWQTVTQTQAWNPAETALVVCDVWDRHWCRGANERLAPMLPHMNQVVRTLRERGVLIVHAPSDTMAFYEGSEARRRVLEAPKADPPPALPHDDPPLPIDASDGGADTGETSWHKAWTRQHPVIEIDPSRDAISDNGRDLLNLYRQRGIRHVLILGVHTNMCVLNRSFAIKQMVRWGFDVALVRDLTDTMYNPARPPYVPHDEGTRLVVAFIEKFWCPTVSRDDLLAPPGGQLRLATCQFPVSADVRANGEWVRRQLREAKPHSPDLVHFPECALSGYPGADHKTLDGFDWTALAEETRSIMALAKELRVWVVLGSIHRLTGDHKPHNSLYVIGPDGQIADRYDKRFCTGGDLRHFSPGDHSVTFHVAGVRCGLLICYDARFPELYREYAKAGVQLMLHSFYNARQKPGAIHPTIMPVTVQAHAGINYMFVSANNSSAEHSWQSRFITPDGLVAAELILDQPGVMVNTVDTAQRYYDAGGKYRAECLGGKLNSGDAVDDPRSRDRKGL